MMAQPATASHDVTEAHGRNRRRPAPPHPAWVVTLDVTLTLAGGASPVYAFTPTTDDSGNFMLIGVAPGTYDVRVKAPHTCPKNSLSNNSRGMEAQFTLTSGIPARGLRR